MADVAYHTMIGVALLVMAIILGTWSVVSIFYGAIDPDRPAWQTFAFWLGVFKLTWLTALHVFLGVAILVDGTDDGPSLFILAWVMGSMVLAVVAFVLFARESLPRRLP